MGKIFDMDNPFWQFMTKLFDLMMLNVLFIICSIPIFTIGASLTAMYYVTLKMVRNEESYIVKGFFKSFKQNFIQATLIWLIFLIAAAIVGVDLYITGGSFGNLLSSGTLTSVMRVLLLVVVIFMLFTFSFVFPLLAKFDNTVKNTIKNALLMSMRHFPTTIVCIVVLIADILLFYFPITVLLSIFLLFSVSAYICSGLFVKVFDNYIPKEDTDVVVNEDGI